MQLIEVLIRSRELGFLGPEDVENHISHAKRFEGAIPEAARTAIDLGSGGGVPGLMLAQRFSDMEWFLLDGSAKRCGFLRGAVKDLELPNARVLEGRAEDLARLPEMRHSAEVVVARSFGSPAVVAECATGFLAQDGRLIVSEPPTGSQRWDALALHQFGMEPEEELFSGVAVIRQAEVCGERWPRRNGVPTKRPIY